VIYLMIDMRSQKEDLNRHSFMTLGRDMRILLNQTEIANIKPGRLTILFALGVLFSIAHASAYIGPATASMIWQMMLAALLSIGYLVHIYWDRIKIAFKKQLNKSNEKE